MFNKIKKSADRNYWMDSNGNKWNMFKYTKKDAEKLSKTLIDCYDCKDCEHCYNCICCDTCTFCSDCNNCTYCDYCDKCTQCADCRQLTGCNMCEYIRACTIFNNWELEKPPMAVVNLNIDIGNITMRYNHENINIDINGSKYNTMEMAKSACRHIAVDDNEANKTIKTITNFYELIKKEMERNCNDYSNDSSDAPSASDR